MCILIYTASNNWNTEMRPLTPDTNKGRTWAGDDIHRRTADQPQAARRARAKTAKHAARQDGQRQAALERAHQLEARVKELQEEQDKLLAPHALALLEQIRSTPANADAAQKQALRKAAQEFPYGFYRSELVTALHQTFGTAKL
ncbi:hypothetical protein LMG26857_03567 [Achromobacter anxifer]|nr:hypothetical protein LMG26857_03567 [Achromobacter anxifer]